jgi:putative nucleotidyltransferase with HDIG domain
MLIERNKVKEAFQTYVENYNHNEPRIKLKIEHTYRVAVLSEKIARSLHLKEEEVELAWMIGMLHDIGRFEQLKNYGTFMDAKSINHAHYGVEILFDKGLIRKFIQCQDYDSIIKTAIWHHNAYLLPEELDEYTTLFCNLIRDADKIDILKVNVETPLQTVYDFSEEQIKQSVVTTQVMESYFKHQAVKHSLKKSPLDYMVGHISLAFELVFPISLAIVEAQGYLKKLLSFKPDNELAIKQFKELEREMEQYVKSIN